METVTMVTLEGVQTLLKTVPPVVAFSVQESSGGRAVVFASPLGERALENGDSGWSPGPPHRAVDDPCGDRLLGQRDRGVVGDPSESDNIAFLRGCLDVPDHDAALLEEPVDLGPVSTSLGFAEEEPGKASIPKNSQRNLGKIPALRDSREGRSCDRNVVGTGLEAQGTACAGAADSTEEPGSSPTLSHPPREGGIAPATPCHQGEPDLGVDPSERAEELCGGVALSGHTGPPGPVPSVVVSYELPRIVKHKPSSIAFSDYPAPRCARLCVSEGPSGAGSSSEDDDDDDVFPELPQCRGFLAGRRRRGELKGSGMGTGRDAPVDQGSVCNGGCRAESCREKRAQQLSCR
ncbi:uncharacterized protein LOC135235721 [Anguilla rostrata]|uniref:uncharacterized protein LOC135235721 n=1 Tax=Anguilla rostrata TaxID=7938 RepID=UPI0030CA6F27